MRFMASVSYDGSKYHGFQKLKKVKTVQGELEKVIAQINKNIVAVKGAGRTDRGVHALGQIIHFDLNIDIDQNNLKNAINSLLDSGIYVNYCKKVGENFHARFNALEKTYEYIINLGPYNPLADNYLYNYNHNLNIKLMRRGAKYLRGYHSYKAFVNGPRENYNSLIYKVRIKKQKNHLIISFVGLSFYTHMVRNMIGALIMVGARKIKPEGIEEMLIKECNLYNYATVPAAGLYLVNIKY